MLTDEHYGRLNQAAVPNLCRLLDSRDRVLVLALLGALRKVGDGRALKPVSRLAAFASDTQVQAAAAELAPLLQLRFERETDSQKLLRAAHSPDTTEALLRPAADDRATPAEQLLRPESSSWSAGTG